LEIFLGFSQVIRQHLWNLIRNRIPSVTFGADEQAFCNLFLLFEDVKFEWIVLVYGTGKDVQESSLQP